MSDNNNNFDFLNLLLGTDKPATPNPFARAILTPPVKRPTSGSLAALARTLSQPAKPKPPALSVET